MATSQTQTVLFTEEEEEEEEEEIIQIQSLLNSFLSLMDKKKNVSASAAAASKVIDDLINSNSKLVKKGEKRRKEINALKMHLLGVVREKNAVTRELEKIQSEKKSFKRRLYPVAATATFCAATAIIGFSYFKGWRLEA